MSKADEWAPQPGETPEAWLERLIRVRSSGAVSARDEFVFGVRLRQARQVVGKVTVDLGGAETAEEGNTDVYDRRATDNAARCSVTWEMAKVSPALQRIKDIYRQLTPEEQRVLALWVSAGCPADSTPPP